MSIHNAHDVNSAPSDHSLDTLKFPDIFLIMRGTHAQLPMLSVTHSIHVLLVLM